jgi:hypothetical protein
MFACNVCGHNTRHTGGDNADLKLCSLCYDLAGEDNHISDNQKTYESADNVRAMCAALDKQSGEGTAKREFPSVCAAVGFDQPVPVAAPAAETEMLMTIDAACKFIRASRNRAIHIAVHQHAPIEGDVDKVFPIYGHIKVSAPVACQFVQDAYKGFEERGGRVRINILGSCMFVGQ